MENLSSPQQSLSCYFPVTADFGCSATELKTRTIFHFEFFSCEFIVKVELTIQKQVTRVITQSNLCHLLLYCHGDVENKTKRKKNSRRE